MTKWKVIVILAVVVASLLKLAKGNTPPTLSMQRDWSVNEDEPIGTVITRITAQDYDGDNISFSVDKPGFGQDGSQLVDIDQRGIVRLAKSLKGMGAKSFFLHVAAFDGKIAMRNEARLDVVSSQGKSAPSALFAALNPMPPPAGFRLPQQGRPAFLNPPFGHPGRGPPLPFSFNEPEPSGSPPLLVLPTSSHWAVPALAPVGTHVATVEAHDLTNDPFYFTIKRGGELVSINKSTGEVTVKVPLQGKVGDHVLLVAVTNRHGTADAEALLQVLPDEAVHGMLDIGTETSTTVILEDSGLEVTTKPTLIAIVNNGPTPPPTTQPPSAKEEEVEPIETDNNTTVLIFIGIPVSLACGLILWCCCCKKTKKNKRRLSKQESTKSCDKKGLELTPVSSASSSLSRQGSKIISNSLPPILRFWERSSSENKYESENSPPAVPSRSISSKDSTFSLTSEPTDEWEFPRHKLKVLGILGEGCFGQVWQYEATDIHGPGSGKCFVAVKTLKESAGPQEKKDLQQELKVLKTLGKHTNVVSLLACCTEKEPTLVVLEYLVNGKLQSYLRDRRAQMPYDNLHGSSATLSPRDLAIFAFQVAKGMDYLTTHGIVHRDLAARNVLVGKDKVCKVADFGFARDIANNHVYERKSDGRLPIRWMALESLFDNIFSSKTDVWSFGILLWEIVTLGSTPYPGMAAEEVMKKIKSGYRLEKPSYCKREMYNIMYYCWYEDPKDRPSFKELIRYLENLITSEVDYIELNKFPERTYYNINTTAASGELL